MKRILFLADYPVDGNVTSGVQSATLSLIDGCSAFADRHEVHVATISSNVSSVTQMERNGVTLHILPSVRDSMSRPRVFWNGRRARSFILALDPDVVNVIDHPAFALATAPLSIPKTFTVHGIKAVESRVWEGKGKLNHRLDAWIERRALASFSNFIAISPYVREILAARAPHATRIVDIPNAVPESFFQCTRQTPRVLTILNVGSYSRLKAQHELLECVASLQRSIPVRCMLCGSPDDESYLASLRTFSDRIQDLDIRVNGGRDEVRDLMSRASILVHTSRQENTPMVFLEAMAAGLPILAKRAGGIPHLFQNESLGTLAESNADVEQLIRTYAVDASSFEQKALRAQRFVRDTFHPRRVAEMTLDFLCSLA